MNNNFFSENDKKLKKLILEKKQIDNKPKRWTKELQEKYKLLSKKIKTLKDVNKYFDPLNKIFVKNVKEVSKWRNQT